MQSNQLVRTDLDSACTVLTGTMTWVIAKSMLRQEIPQKRNMLGLSFEIHTLIIIIKNNLAFRLKN
ncbi:hypothetical protein AALO_G00137030 [Alosa alosa]|uniref:Uncharacterized protein n=1 Tax=Alosa alosa TaxID=278164 RepID=A0AAV6GKZ2_9TELE|nr:hypothetical protein AALO_G00137030 [Alosa alosa]